MPRLKLATACITVALAGTTGFAFAGSLPGAAQSIASDMLAKAGVSVPSPNSNAGDHPNVRGKSADTAVTTSNSGKGSEISELATSTDLKGVAKGAAISTLASGGQSQAGQHGQAAEEHGASSATANAAGRTTAAAASNGHSTAGAENAADGQSHKP